MGSCNIAYSIFFCVYFCPFTKVTFEQVWIERSLARWNSGISHCYLECRNGCRPWCAAFCVKWRDQKTDCSGSHGEFCSEQVSAFFDCSAIVPSVSAGLGFFFVCLFFSFLIFRESILCLEMRSSGWEYKTTITGYKSFPAHDSSGPFCLGLTKALLFFKEMECVGHFDLLF